LGSRRRPRVSSTPTYWSPSTDQARTATRLSAPYPHWHRTFRTVTVTDRRGPVTRFGASLSSYPVENGRPAFTGLCWTNLQGGPLDRVKCSAAVSRSRTIQPSRVTAWSAMRLEPEICFEQLYDLISSAVDVGYRQLRHACACRYFGVHVDNHVHKISSGS
jgi:hypothetical protein